jgi:hypothetical protein
VRRRAAVAVFDGLAGEHQDHGVRAEHGCHHVLGVVGAASVAVGVRPGSGVAALHGRSPSERAAQPAHSASADDRARAQIAADTYRGLPDDERAGIASAVATTGGMVWLGGRAGPDEDAAAQPAYAPQLVTVLTRRGHLTAASELLPRSRDHGSEPWEAALARRGRPGPGRLERLRDTGLERAPRANGGALQQVPSRPVSPASGRAPVR